MELLGLLLGQVEKTEKNFLNIFITINLIIVIIIKGNMNDYSNLYMLIPR